MITYPSTCKALYQNGHQKVKQHIIANNHECDEVKRCPVINSTHAIIHDEVPVLLCKDLKNGVVLVSYVKYF